MPERIAQEGLLVGEMVGVQEPNSLPQFLPSRVRTNFEYYQDLQLSPSDSTPQPFTMPTYWGRAYGPVTPQPSSSTLSSITNNYIGIDPPQWAQAPPVSVTEWGVPVEEFEDTSPPPLLESPEEVSFATSRYLVDNRKAIAKHETQGGTTVYSTPHRLLLDIDSIRDRKHFDRALPLVKELFPQWDLDVDEWESQSGNCHLMISLFAKDGTVPRVEPAARVALELALGSDRTRGLFGLARLMNGVLQNPREISVLFRPKEEDEE